MKKAVLYFLLTACAIAQGFPWSLTAIPAKTGVSGIVTLINQTRTVTTQTGITYGDVIINRGLSSKKVSVTLTQNGTYPLDGMAGVRFGTPAEVSYSPPYATAQLPAGYVWAFNGSSQATWTDSFTTSIIGTSGNVYTSSAFPFDVKRTDTFVSWVNGTWGSAATVYTTSALNASIASGTSAAVALPTWSTFTPSTHSYARNSSTWLPSGLDITCVSAGYSGNSSPQYMVLVTPQHALCAYHYSPTVSSTVDFLTSSGVVVTATVQAVVAIGTSNSNDTANYTDIGVVTFSAAVPATIKPAKLAPSGWAAHNLPGVWAGPLEIMFRANNGGETVVMQGNGANNTFGPQNYLYATTSTSPAMNYQPTGGLGTGDSSSPSFFVNASAAPAELVLITQCYTTQYGPDDSFYTAQIQAVLDADYSAARTVAHYYLTTADLSAYTAY